MLITTIGESLHTLEELESQITPTDNTTKNTPLHIVSNSLFEQQAKQHIRETKESYASNASLKT